MNVGMFCNSVVSYGFYIRNYCNPRVHYETPCIVLSEMIMNNEQERVTAYFKTHSRKSPGQLKKVMKSLRIDINITTI